MLKKIIFIFVLFLMIIWNDINIYSQDYKKPDDNPLGLYPAFRDVYGYDYGQINCVEIGLNGFVQKVYKEDISALIYPEIDIYLLTRYLHAGVTVTGYISKVSLLYGLAKVGYVIPLTPVTFFDFQVMSGIVMVKANDYDDAYAGKVTLKIPLMAQMFFNAGLQVFYINRKDANEDTFPKLFYSIPVSFSVFF